MILFSKKVVIVCCDCRSHLAFNVAYDLFDDFILLNVNHVGSSQNLSDKDRDNINFGRRFQNFIGCILI